MTDEISTIKGVFVFAATIIGAGILALPVAAATTGLVPMLMILLVVGGVSVFSALYIAETVINIKGDCGQGICFTLKTGSSLIYKRTGLIIGLKVL